MRQPPKVWHDVDTCEKNGFPGTIFMKKAQSKYSTTAK